MSIKYCTNCGTQLPDEPLNYCSLCGFKLSQETNANKQETIANKSNTGEATLITLCILTILGSIFGILKGLYFETAFDYSAPYTRGFSDTYPIFNLSRSLVYVSIVCNVATLIAAIYMLMRKKAGYVIYMAAQSINEVAFISWLSYSMWGSVQKIFIPTALTSVLPAVVFMILYTILVKKLLR
ncbi:MAG: zinc ribbon domain-containing protein [Bacteroidetes bacterium]|nr:zinc ribbon domain-containing protein [Bacteroidota bacterium]